MDQTRRELLAGARFARDVHRRLRARELGDHLPDLHQRRALAEEPPVQPLVARRRLAAVRQRERRAHQRADLLGLGQERLDLAEVEQRIAALRLLHDPRHDVALASGELFVGHLPLGVAELLEDHLLRRLCADASLEVVGDGDLLLGEHLHLETLAVRQAHVGETEVVALLLQLLLRLGDGADRCHIEPHAHQRELEQLADVGLVVDDQDVGGGSFQAARASRHRMRKWAPELSFTYSSVARLAAQSSRAR